jgi:tetratricopeptide (TPR) repeat protein
MNQQTVEGLLQRGEIDQAMHACNTVLQVTPNNTRVIGYLGMCYFRKQDYANALNYFRRATILDPQFVDAGLKLAQCLDRLRRYEEAHDVAAEFLKIQPANTMLRSLVEQLKPYVQGNKQGWERTATLNYTVHVTNEG